jgi:hypothetical protein
MNVHATPQPAFPHHSRIPRVVSRPKPYYIIYMLTALVLQDRIGPTCILISRLASLDAHGLAERGWRVGAGEG